MQNRVRWENLEVVRSFYSVVARNAFRLYLDYRGVVAVGFAKIKWAGFALGIGALLLCSRVVGSGDTISVRTLVVDSVDEAAKFLQELKSGADFAALAREKSTDATS